LPGKGNLFASTSVAGPGFINVTFKPSLLAQRVGGVVHNAVGMVVRLSQHIYENNLYICPKSYIYLSSLSNFNQSDGKAASPKLSSFASRRAIVDYSSPNIAKVRVWLL
jgi:arginyl-tRNA synthetase